MIGEVKAKIIEARFALSGKTSRVNKTIGDIVKKWDVIASLDRKILQTELDRQLAEFEKVRADFEAYAQKNAEPQNDLDKYLKQGKQAQLDVSVKEVELAKAKLDMADLLSPVDGIIIDDSGIVPGLYVTPASSGVKIIDTSSYYFQVEVEQKDIKDFKQSKEATIKIDDLDEPLKFPTPLIFSDGKNFFLNIPLVNVPGILLGMKGSAIFK